jgi:arginine deiminase
VAGPDSHGGDTLHHVSSLVNPIVYKGFDAIEISCDGLTTANIICLGDKEVIVERSNREAIRQLEVNGLIVHDLDLSEFVKGTGGPNCLIMPVERK